MKSTSLSEDAARSLRGGILAHVSLSASPVATTVRLDLQAARNAYPEAVFIDP